MAGGEFIGIVAMKVAEVSTSCFIFHRPHDLHFIIASVAVALALIPMWPSHLWFISGAAMMFV